jgi:hypothetical protein
MIFIPLSIEKTPPIWPPVHPLNLTYFEISSATWPERTCLYILLIFHLPNLISILSLRFLIQGIRPGSRALGSFRNKLIYYGEELLAPHPILKSEGDNFSVVCHCFFNIFAATLHTCSASPPSTIWGRAMPWCKGTHLICLRSNTEIKSNYSR